MAFDLPGDPLGDQHFGHAPLLAELPVGAVGVGARVEVRRAAEVVLGLGRVGDLAADARQAEHADRLALVRVAEQVELAALEQQVVGVDAARAHLVALHRVVVEDDRLVAEDRRLDLRQARRELVAAGRGGDAERDRVLLGRPQRAGTPPGDLLQRQAQRLGVGEFAVEQAQRGLQRRELLVGERDRGQVEVLRAQRVVLLLGRPVGGALDGQLDAQRFELGAVRVEAPRERVLVHAAVALHVAPDLQRRDRPALGHQVGDQRQLADQLLGVLCHRLQKIEARGERILARGLRALAICGLSRGRRVGAAGVWRAPRLRAPAAAARGEEGAAADRAVEARPALAGGELLLEPVEAAEPPAEVVDHVHERRLARARHDRAAVLERAVVGEDDVPDRLRQLRAGSRRCPRSCGGCGSSRARSRRAAAPRRSGR